MKSFAPESRMYTLGGVFYPTGHMFIMYPTAEEAADAEKRLLQSGWDNGPISLLTPKDIHEKIAAAVEHEGEGMPSPGTEGATARHYEELAREGHHAILVPAPKAKEAEQ